MASKCVMDFPGLLDETLLTLTAACKHFPVRCGRASVERWIRSGSRGTILESVLICGKRYTSREAIDRFVRNQLQVEPDRSPPKRGTKSKRDIEAACIRYGLPTPLGTAGEQKDEQIAKLDGESVSGGYPTAHFSNPENK